MCGRLRQFEGHGGRETLLTLLHKLKNILFKCPFLTSIRFYIFNPKQTHDRKKRKKESTQDVIPAYGCEQSVFIASTKLHCK